MTDLERPVANPTVVLREEFDDWAVLFDPDSGEAYGLDPVSVFIWQLFDGKHTPPEILEKLREACEDGIPDEAPDHLKEFVEDLTSKGLVGYAEAAQVGYQMTEDRGRRGVIFEPGTGTCERLQIRP